MPGPISTGNWIAAAPDPNAPGVQCSAPVSDPHLVVFDEATCVSTHIEVTDKPVILRAMRFPTGSQVCVEMVYGCGGGDEFAPLHYRGCAPVCLNCHGAVIPLVLSGRYRLKAQAGLCGPLDLLITWHETDVVLDIGSLITVIGP